MPSLPLDLLSTSSSSSWRPSPCWVPPFPKVPHSRWTPPASIQQAEERQLEEEAKGVEAHPARGQRRSWPSRRPAVLGAPCLPPGPPPADAFGPGCVKRTRGERRGHLTPLVTICCVLPPLGADLSALNPTGTSQRRVESSGEHECRWIAEHLCLLERETSRSVSSRSGRARPLVFLAVH